MTAASSIRQANQGSYDFYLASTPTPPAPGARTDTRSSPLLSHKREAAAARRTFRAEPARDLPAAAASDDRATTSLGEVRQPRFPSVLLEIGYHDNYEDAQWIENNIDPIAQSLVQSLTAYFGLPFTSIRPRAARLYGTRPPRAVRSTCAAPPPSPAWSSEKFRTAPP